MDNGRHSVNTIRALTMVCILGLVSAGCGRRSDDGDRETGTRQRRSQERIDLETKEGRVTIDTGRAAELPRDFPKDVSIPKGGAVQMVMQVPDGMMLTVGVNEEMHPVVSSYRSATARNGWAEETVLDMGANVTIVFAKNGRNLQAVFAEDKGMTTVNLILSSR